MIGGVLSPQQATYGYYVSQASGFDYAAKVAAEEYDRILAEAIKELDGPLLHPRLVKVHLGRVEYFGRKARRTMMDAIEVHHLRWHLSFDHCRKCRSAIRLLSDFQPFGMARSATSVSSDCGPAQE